MKKNIYTYIILPLFAITVQSMDIFGQHQSKHWHKPLVQLYYKNAKNKPDPDVSKQINLFHKACSGIQDIEEINGKKAKDFGKNALTTNRYELDVLKLYYLFTKLDKKETLTQQEITVGENSLVKLYNKGKRRNKKNSIQEILNASPKKKKNVKENKIDYDFLVCGLIKRFHQTQKVDKSSVSSNESKKLSLGYNPSNLNVENSKLDTLQNFVQEDTKNLTPLDISDKELKKQKVINHNGEQEKRESRGTQSVITENDKLKQNLYNQDRQKRDQKTVRQSKNLQVLTDEVVQLRSFKKQHQVEKKNLKKEIKDLKDQLKDKKKPSTNLNEDEKNSTYLGPIIYLSTGAIISLLAIKIINAHSTGKTVDDINNVGGKDEQGEDLTSEV